MSNLQSVGRNLRLLKKRRVVQNYVAVVAPLRNLVESLRKLLLNPDASLDVTWLLRELIE